MRAEWSGVEWSGVEVVGAACLLAAALSFGGGVQHVVLRFPLGLQRIKIPVPGMNAENYSTHCLLECPMQTTSSATERLATADDQMICCRTSRLHVKQDLQKVAILTSGWLLMVMASVPYEGKAAVRI